jgi:hypothetical protein
MQQMAKAAQEAKADSAFADMGWCGAARGGSSGSSGLPGRSSQGPSRNSAGRHALHCATPWPQFCRALFSRVAAHPFHAHARPIRHRARRPHSSGEGGAPAPLLMPPQPGLGGDELGLGLDDDLHGGGGGGGGHGGTATRALDFWEALDGLL